jgi:hypothetical protein
MDILSLPPELFHMVLVAAVHVRRRLDRALRLRLVNRLFSRAAINAIFDTRILEDPSYGGGPHDGFRGCSARYSQSHTEFWTRYMVHRVLHIDVRDAAETWKLRTIRRIVDYFVDLDRQSDDPLLLVGGDDEAALSDRRLHYTRELCRLCSRIMGEYPKGRHFGEMLNAKSDYLRGCATIPDRDLEEENRFREELFAAACYLNKLDVVDDFLTRCHDGYYLETSTRLAPPLPTSALRLVLVPSPKKVNF